MGGARNSLPKSLGGEWYKGEPASFPAIPFELANAEVERLARELDITNADNIALCLEANTMPDELMSQCISWLAGRIVEAYEAASTPTPSPDRQDVERLREALEDTQATLSAVKAEAIVDGGGTCLWIAEKLNQQMIDNRAALSTDKGEASRG
jgi:hypothetical protein